MIWQSIRRFFGTGPKASLEDHYRTMFKAQQDAYTEWANSQHCIGCGMAFKDRLRGKMWVTEYECMECFEKRCKKARGE